ncbi:MAG: hypothetical protein AAGC93_31370 [Cyanobacteria bacterium P01_F01_bin.53]
MATVKRPVYLISEQQRHALLNYLKDRPYREVASGIQFLMNAPTAQVDVELPDDANAKMSEGEATEATSATDKELVHS